MIKLIVSDMDGTLLDDEKKISEGFYTLLPKLKEKNIKFMAASGRQYPSLANLFADHKEDVVIIAENGAYVVDNDKEIYSSALQRDFMHFCLDCIYSVENIEPMVCAKRCSYTTNPQTFTNMQSEKFQYEMRLVENLYEIQDDVIKVSLIDHSTAGPEKHSFPRLAPLLSKKAEIAVSGVNCVDIVNKGVSKGSAIAAIQEKWGISVEETMSFGDNYNDIEMLQQAKYSFAMENADMGVKKFARYIAPDNNRDGVVQSIRKFIQF